MKSCVTLAAATASLLFCGLAAAASLVSVDLVRDLNVGPGPESASPARARAIGGRVYFAATTPELGNELYSVDASAGAPRLERDIAVGPLGSTPVPLGAAGGKIIVFADDGVHGNQLWAIAPGGAQAQRLTSHAFAPTDLYPAFTPRPSGVLGERLIVQTGRSDDTRLWSTDGTAQGTFDLTGPTGFRERRPDSGCLLGGALVFFAQSAVARTDGSVAGTTKLADIGDARWGERVVRTHGVGGLCYFLVDRGGSSGWALVVSNGTTAFTFVATSDTEAAPLGLGSLNGVLYLADTTNWQFRLHRNTPGTPFFTKIYQQYGSTGPAAMAEVAGKLVFVPPRGLSSGDYALGISDGTASGTRYVWPLGTNRPSWSGDFFVLGGRVMPKLASGVPAFIDAASGAIESMPQGRYENFFDTGAVLGGVVYGPGDSAVGRELWRSDGTVAGTALFADLWTSTRDGIEGGGYQPEPRVIDGVLYAGTAPEPDPVAFLMNNTLVRSDGSDAGTFAMLPGAHPAGGTVQEIVPLGTDGIAFRVGDRFAPSHVYAADRALTTATSLTNATVFDSPLLQAGDTALFLCGTADPWLPNLCRAAPGGGPADVLRAGFPAPNVEARATPLGTLGGVGVFRIYAGVWRSDGTAPGTFALFDGTAPAVTDISTAAVVLNDKLYFGACVDNGTCALYATDATVAGTTRVAALPHGAFGEAVAMGNRFAFLYYTTLATQMQLWSSDGSANGTTLLYAFDQLYGNRIAAIGNRAHVLVGCISSTCAARYVVTDGTPAGTRAISTGIYSPVGDTLVAADDDAMVFSCRSIRAGDELCAVDREGRDATLVDDIYPGATSSNAQYLGRTPAGLLFAANDGRHGVELWRLVARPDRLFASGFEGQAP